MLFISAIAVSDVASRLVLLVVDTDVGEPRSRAILNSAEEFNDHVQRNINVVQPLALAKGAALRVDEQSLAPRSSVF